MAPLDLDLDLDLALDPAPFSRLVIASTNAGKIREFRQLLAGMGLEIDAQPGDLEVEETGATFAENARLKAITVARHSGSWTLNGAPGVHSARYAATDPARISRLLHELAGSSDRTARFSAALALADPNGNVRIEVEGLCAGVILEAPRGEGGFGYDPVFFVPETGLTYAEMDQTLKGRIGHRGRAFAQLETPLRELLGS
jgi:XTP/dITP diphosphohydrolase